jgi:predicted RNase H-like nuclease
MRIGIDGCRIGWFCVYRDGQNLDYCVFPDLAQLFEQWHGETIAIDIPIGLPDAWDRDVDRAARRMLGARRSSVFPVPIRPTLGAPDRIAASVIGEQIDGRRLAMQTWAIVPKIVELDGILRENLGLLDSVHECHPEVCWAAMNDGQPMNNNKKGAAGRAERLALLERHFGRHGREVYDSARNRFLRREVALDDILDAFACLFTAERIDTGEAVHILDRLETDRFGIPMQMAC